MNARRDIGRLRVHQVEPGGKESNWGYRHGEAVFCAFASGGSRSAGNAVGGFTDKTGLSVILRKRIGTRRESFEGREHPRYPDVFIDIACALGSYKEQVSRRKYSQSIVM